MFTEAATGWHVLRVEGYSKISGPGVARSQKSCQFVVGGHTWRIAFFPDGLTEDSADCISFALRFEDRAVWTGREDIMVRTTFSLYGVVGSPVPSFTVSRGVWTFSRLGEAWSDARFMGRKEFESSYVKHDGFSVRCDVTVLSPSSAPANPPPSRDLRRHLGDLLASGDGADVTLEVGGQLFRVHKDVLAARSPVFKAEFFGGPHNKEKCAASVSIDGIEPSVFKALLHFIYTDSFPDIDGGSTAMAHHLLVAADRYGVDRLKSMCEFLLCNFFDASAVVSTLVIAEQHGCHQLKEACFEFLRSSGNYKEEVVVGEDLQYLESSCPSLLHELRSSGEIFENVDSKQHDCLDITLATLFDS